MVARRVVLAWELGGGFGHLARLRLLARHLSSEGHHCVVAVGRPDVARHFLGSAVAEVVQAPRRAAPPRDPVSPQLSYASLLHNVGFDDPVHLAERIGTWRRLLSEMQVDFMVCDHSPVAMVAATTLGVPTLRVGTGFTVPPLTQPFPSFQPHMVVPKEMLEHNEAAVHASLSRALERLGLRSFERLLDLFAGTAPGLFEYPELDHYEGPRPERHLGVPYSSEGESPQWPPGDRPRVLVYLRGSNTAGIVDALSTSRLQVLAVTDRLVDLRVAAETCDAFVNHASHGFVSEMLLAGKPGVLVPRFHEQLLLARRVVAMGAGIVPTSGRPSDVAVALDRLLEDPGPRRAAEAFAARYQGEDRDEIVPELLTSSCSTD